MTPAPLIPGAADRADLERAARAAGAMIDREVDGAPWILLVGNDWNSRGWATYVSNGIRADCIRWLRETADRMDRYQDAAPGEDRPPVG